MDSVSSSGDSSRQRRVLHRHIMHLFLDLILGSILYGPKKIAFHGQTSSQKNRPRKKPCFGNSIEAPFGRSVSDQAASTIASHGLQGTTTPFLVGAPWSSGCSVLCFLSCSVKTQFQPLKGVWDRWTEPDKKKPNVGVDWVWSQKEVGQINSGTEELPAFFMSFLNFAVEIRSERDLKTWTLFLAGAMISPVSGGRCFRPLCRHHGRASISYHHCCDFKSAIFLVELL